MTSRNLKVKVIFLRLNISATVPCKVQQCDRYHVPQNVLLFQRYCRFSAQKMTPPLFHPNFGGVLIGPDHWCWGWWEEVFQLMCPPYLIVTDRQTDGQTTYCGITALCIALLGYNSTNNNYLIYKAPCGCNFTGTELHWTHNKRVSFVVPHCKCHCYAHITNFIWIVYKNCTQL